MLKQQFLNRMSLTTKMVLVTVIVGITTWIFIDYFQTRTVKNIFLGQLKERLNKEAQDDRIRFDNYIKAHHHSVKMLASQKRLIDHVANKDWQDNRRVLTHLHPPQWLPRPSMLRSLVQIRYAVLLDASGKTREIFQGMSEPAPAALLYPTELLQKLSHNQAFMTSIGDEPFLITSEFIKDSQDRPLAALMLASPLDREFLIASQGSYHDHLYNLMPFALLTGGDKEQILVSTDQNMPQGTRLDDLKDHFLISSKSFFDYGASDLFLGFVSFISMDEVEALSRSVISRNRQQRAMAAVILISVFTLIMFLITRRIMRLTKQVSLFSEQVLHMMPQSLEHGDELDILEERFRDLTKEVVASQEIIKRDYDFQRTISLILQISLQPVSLDEILENILEAIIAMPFLAKQAKGCIYLVEDEPEVMVMKAQYRMPEAIRKHCAKVPFGRCLCGLAATTREIVYADQVSDCHELKFTGNMFPHSHYCFPIISGEKVLGGLNLYVEEKHKRNPEEERLLYSVSNTLAGIIERKRAEQDKQKLQEQLIQAEKLSALGRMTANVAHEIRTPLTLVGGFARRLNKKSRPEAGERNYAQIIISEVSRLEKVLTNVLTYSRESNLHLEDHDINELLDGTLKLFEDRCKERSIEIKRAFGDVPRIMIDKNQIIEVINNLLANAIDSMPNGGSLETITKKDFLNDTPYLSVKVIDTGEGIAEEKINMIFEPFFTTKVLGRGTGLGLPICKKIMEDHEGLIRFESQVGKGSSFSLYFPYERSGQKSTGG